MHESIPVYGFQKFIWLIFDFEHNVIFCSGCTMFQLSNVQHTQKILLSHKIQIKKTLLDANTVWKENEMEHNKMKTLIGWQQRNEIKCNEAKYNEKPWLDAKSAKSTSFLRSCKHESPDCVFWVWFAARQRLLWSPQWVKPQVINVHICVYIFLCICIHICICVYVNMYTHTHIDICIYTYMYIHICIHTCIQTYLHIHVYVYIYVCI